jgi:hypothetical protein
VQLLSWIGRKSKPSTPAESELTEPLETDRYTTSPQFTAIADQYRATVRDAFLAQGLLTVEALGGALLATSILFDAGGQEDHDIAMMGLSIANLYQDAASSA